MTGGSQLRLANDGELVLYDPQGKEIIFGHAALLDDG